VDGARDQHRDIDVAKCVPEPDPGNIWKNVEISLVSTFDHFAPREKWQIHSRLDGSKMTAKDGRLLLMQRRCHHQTNHSTPRVSMK
jgi:hypothetical protein